ncbi:hypothetical protein ACFX5Q_21775 [Mesorhizobium sp. IMUNJ 23033]|uniref:hypothetical protein n=1 Tax=Mesorhizobium sp. IMUNJ 23033 TaxID=3378039 RepID=UPI00384A5B47
MPGCSLEEGAERAEALRQAIRQLHLTHRGRTLGTVTVSFGVAAYPEHGAGWAEIHQCRRSRALRCQGRRTRQGRRRQDQPPR